MQLQIPLYPGAGLLSRLPEYAQAAYEVKAGITDAKEISQREDLQTGSKKIKLAPIVSSCQIC